MILNELHPEEHQLLKQLFATDEQVTVHSLDAYQSLKAHLPPFARRGLVLIDPAFEVKDEWQRVEQGLQAALTRWATGIYAIWYPIKDKAVVERFAKTIKAMAQGKYLRAEIQPYADDFAFGLKACGMIVINPPWQLAEQLQTSMPVLWQYLSPHQQGHYRVEGPTC
jgi:23S rRNA (adenine2030-N6)-methyltransferase